MRQFTCSMLLMAAGFWVAPTACRKPEPARVPDVVIASAPVVPVDPSDPAWEAAPEHIARLVPQDLVEPRQMGNTTAEVRVRALANATDVAFRLEWTDTTSNSLPGPSRFSDACAIQTPTRIEPSVPAPQMGETDRPVEITYWNAAWQATVDGRGDSINDLYPNAAIDHYPFEAASLVKGSPAQQEMVARYAPARSLGNPMAGPRGTPVQDLIAEGPGTLTAATSTGSSGRGRRTAQGWAVVIRRRLPEGLGNPGGSQIAVAVWEGSVQEVGARKMRTGWIPLALQVKP